jgi:hypothetical protein
MAIDLSALSEEQLREMSGEPSLQKENAVKSKSDEELRMLAGNTPNLTPKAEITPQMQDKYKIWKENPKAASYLYGLREPLDALAQIPPALLASGFRQAGLKNVADYFENEAHTINKEAKDAYNVARGGDQSFDPRRLAGNIASPVNLLAGAGMGLATKGMGAIGQGIGQGVVGGLTQEADDPNQNIMDQKIGQVGISVLGSHLINAFGNVLGKALMPKLSDQLQKLKDAGVDISRLSIGQALGGLYKKTEDFLRDVVPGGAVERAQQQGVNEFSKGLVRNVATDLGLDIPEHFNTQQAIGAVSNKISELYNTILPKIGTIEPTARSIRLAQASRAVAMKDINDPAVLKEYDALVKMVNKRFITDPNGNSTMFARNFKDLDTRLGEEINTAFSSTADNAIDQKAKARALLLLQQSMRKMAEAKDPTGVLKLANSANTALALPKRTAGTYVEAMKNEGAFTPSQLMTSVKVENTADKLARGQGRMQQVAQAGEEVLGNKAPSVGQRALEYGATGAGIGAVGHFGGPEMAGLLTGATALGTNALYNPVVQRILNKTLVDRPQMVNRALSPLASGVRMATPMVNPSLSTAVGAPLTEAGQRLMGDQNANVPMQQPTDIGSNQ